MTVRIGSLKSFGLAIALTVGTMAGSADAATLNGTFNIDVYHYNAGGVQSNADASAAVVAAHGADLLTTITYTGNLDFGAFSGGGNTILEFLTYSGGIVSDTTGLSTLISSGGFQTTTLLDITGFLATALIGDIDHDDGVTLFDKNGNIVLNSATPTPPISSAFSIIAGAFRLIYSAANGNPEVLKVDVSPVPVPAALPLFGTALGAMALLRYRRKRGATSTFAA
jgi:hypothetical protein